MDAIKKIAVVGAGLMGHGIAQIFASKGYSVALMDINEDILTQALDKVRENLKLMAANGIEVGQGLEDFVQRIEVTTDLSEAVKDADFVVEAVLEKLDLKQELFQKMDEMCPSDTILATNTSVISITEISKRAKNRGRILGTHFWNPPYLVPLVEIIRGQDTSDEAMDTTYELLKRVGKHPVRVNKDVPGFVGNRLQHALWREAISIVERGIADAATVDECVKYGFGMRLPVLGPLENADMVGLDLTLAIHDYILRYLESSPDPSPLLKEKVQRKELGFKTGKGLQEWPSERADKVRRALQEHLLAWTKRIAP
ncbi:MAG: 3-hydroxyacyl-CoA dehydrogenase family protein [Deltaproteobacteria bacterium]|nr:MAG: 3-hydroxyacyl-CoA dehydrogenase family protein [Deltaproteobacteria bacterium]